MAQSVTVGTLITRVRDRIDRPVDDGFITDTEIMRYLDSAYKWLYNMLVEKHVGQFEKIQTITSDGSVAYALNSDYYAVLGVELQIDTKQRISLPRIQINERNAFVDTTSGYARAYRIYNNSTLFGEEDPDGIPLGDVIQFYPRPGTGDTYRVFYAPVADTLDGTSDTINGVNGFDELLVIEAAIRCLLKEESSTTQLDRERQMWLDHINAMSENRISESPNRVRDVEMVQHDAGDWFPRQRGFWY